MNPMSISEVRKNLQALILKTAYIKGKVILSSGKESDYYIDARLLTLNAEGAYLCGRMILDMIKGAGIDAVGGPTLGADPMVGAVGSLSFQEGRPIDTFIIRKEPKKHGQQKQVEGPILKSGARVALIDDVATTGKAFLESLDVLEPMGIKVEKLICIVNRREGADEALAKRGYKLTAMFDISEIHK